MKKGASVKLIQRIETLEGLPIHEALTGLYVRQQLSYRMICKRWNTQPAQLIKLIKHCGIEPRKGGEAVKVQWIGNIERRTTQSARMSEFAKTLASRGQHSRLGRTKEDCDSIRKWADSLRTPAAVAKAVTARVKKHREDPTTHPNSKALPSRREQIMLDHFKALGYKPEFSYYLSPYWVDVYLPELGIGIECVNTKRPSWDRHESLTQQGAHMLYVLNDFIDRGDFRQVDEYVTAFKAFSAHSFFRREDAIVWGSKYVFFFPDQPDNALIEVIRMEDLYCLRITDVTNS